MYFRCLLRFPHWEYMITRPTSGLLSKLVEPAVFLLMRDSVPSSSNLSSSGWFSLASP